MKKILFAALALIVVMASCVKDPQYPGVTISSVTYLPTAVQENDDVTVTANVTCFGDVTAKLIYTINDQQPVTVEMKDDVEKNAFTAVIPGQPNDTKVSFYVQAIGDLTASSATYEYTVGAVAIDYSVLRLNELNGHDKFIELYNAGSEAVRLKGVYIEKDGEQNWVGDDAVAIEAGGYLLLYGGDDPATEHPDYPANLFFNSGLSAKKNVRIQLFTPAGESIDDFNLTNIDLNGDTYGYNNNEAPASYSLNSDGQWYYADATPGAANVDGENIVLGLEGGVEPPTPEEPDYSNLVLNELNGETKFIEFYNKGNLDLIMDGMYVKKDDKTDPIWTADATVVIPAHGYVVLYGGDDPAGEHPDMSPSFFFSGGLSSKKTVKLELFMRDGTSRDVFTRGNQDGTSGWNVEISNVKPLSFARTPDGDGDWKLADATPGEANPATGDDIPQE